MTEQIVNLPDLKFMRWCESTFSINRGVYNIIDEKLYAIGIHNIHERRQAILRFLQLHVEPIENKKYFKFGQGNLAEALHQFQQQYVFEYK